MNAVESKKGTLSLHDYLEGIFSGCKGETMSRTLSGATVGSIGSIYLHALPSEDWAVPSLLQGKPKIAALKGVMGLQGLPW